MIKKNAGLKQKLREKFIAAIEKKIETVNEELETSLLHKPVDKKIEQESDELQGLSLG